MLTHWFKTKKRPSIWRRNSFNWLTFLKLSLNCIWVLLNNLLLQKANYLLCFSENLTGIPVELPTSWPVTRLSLAWFGSFRLTDFTAYLLAPVPWRLTGVEIISDPQYIFTTYFMQLQTKTEKWVRVRMWVVWFRCSMVAKWFAWWNSLGLLGFLDYIKQ